jgi:hypothetical protein
MSENLKDLLDRAEKVKVWIGDTPYELPKGQPLLRGLQYLEMQGQPLSVTRGPFCWNLDCQRCICRVRLNDGQERDVNACHFVVEEPLTVCALSEDYEDDLI